MLRSIKVILILFSTAVCVILISNSVSSWNSPQSSELLIINIRNLGRIKGSTTTTVRTNETIYQFLGVPYAESPSGDRRFKAPVPVRRWNGVKDATKYGRACPQLGITDKLNETELSMGDLEDCLSLAIYTKDLSKMANLPVMVYVHGGTFYKGTSYFFPPTYFLERDIVLVVPQFRLDALGFLSTKSDEIPGNAGVLDVIEALKWVQQNIHNFGGDSKKVTVFGQSAGAAMISAIALSPIVPENLFQKLIYQSGSALTYRAYDRNPVQSARDIARRAGLDEDLTLNELNRAFVQMNILKLLRATQQHNDDNLINGYGKMGGRHLTLGGPTNLLPDSAYEIIRSGKYRKDLAVLAGVVKHEGSFLLTAIYDLFESKGLLNDSNFMKYDLIDSVARILGVDDDAGGTTGLASNLYWTQDQLFSGDFTELGPGLIDFIGTFTIKAAILRLVQANARYNPTNTYLYSFDYRGEHTKFSSGKNTSKYPFDGGVYHSDDNIYFFPYPSKFVKLNEADTEISRKMINLWTSFAATGRPQTTHDGNDAVEWPPFIGLTGPYLHIDKEFSLGRHFIKEFAAATLESKTNNV